MARAYLLEGTRGLVLVDAGSSGSEQAILERVEALGGNLELIWLTHAHLDHYGSAAAIRRQTGVPIAAHPADGSALAEGRTPIESGRGPGRVLRLLLPLLERLAPPEPLYPDLWTEEGDRLDAYGLDARVLHTPGHTPGSCTLLVEERWAFVGDLLSTRGRPHLQGRYACDWPALEESISRLAALSLERLYPGHGSGWLSGKMYRRLVRRRTGQRVGPPPDRTR
jgi:glyoxylase-like metal-dependent hydrolase (beta-lactamase superfamily II)